MSHASEDDMRDDADVVEEEFEEPEEPVNSPTVFDSDTDTEDDDDYEATSDKDNNEDYEDEPDGDDEDDDGNAISDKDDDVMAYAPDDGDDDGNATSDKDNDVMADAPPVSDTDTHSRLDPVWIPNASLSAGDIELKRTTLGEVMVKGGVSPTSIPKKMAELDIIFMDMNTHVGAFVGASTQKHVEFSGNLVALLHKTNEQIYAMSIVCKQYMTKATKEDITHIGRYAPVAHSNSISALAVWNSLDAGVRAEINSTATTESPIPVASLGALTSYAEARSLVGSLVRGITKNTQWSGSRTHRSATSIKERVQMLLLLTVMKWMIHEIVTKRIPRNILATSSGEDMNYVYYDACNLDPTVNCTSIWDLCYYNFKQREDAAIGAGSELAWIYAIQHSNPRDWSYNMLYRVQFIYHGCNTRITSLCTSTDKDGIITSTDVSKRWYECCHTDKRIEISLDAFETVWIEEFDKRNPQKINIAPPTVAPKKETTKRKADEISKPMAAVVLTQAEENEMVMLMIHTRLGLGPA